MKEHSELKYLQCLAELYPTIAKASTEIINLQSILNLPKGTEHFITDIHGEYEAFSHVLKNGSGGQKRPGHPDLLSAGKDGSGEKDREKYG